MISISFYKIFIGTSKYYGKIEYKRFDIKELEYYKFAPRVILHRDYIDNKMYVLNLFHIMIVGFYHLIAKSHLMSSAVGQ